MGMFSWNCKGCGHPLLSHGTTEEHNKWMTQGVVLNSHGEIMRGEYDGYGSCGSFDSDECGDDPEMYHEACWEVLGKPTKYTGPSQSARDQGCFFDDGVHNVYAPKTMEDLHNIEVAGDLAQKSSCDNWMITSLECVISQAHDFTNGKMDEEQKDRFVNELNRHIERRTKKGHEEEAKRIGMDYDTYMELVGHLVKLLPEDTEEYKKNRPTANFIKAEKLENGMFRITTHRELIFDRDFANNKVYMVEDSWEEVEPGTELKDWSHGKDDIN